VSAVPRESKFKGNVRKPATYGSVAGSQ